MKTLPEIAGITAPGMSFDVEAISSRLLDGLTSNLILPPQVWGAALRACFDIYRKLWALPVGMPDQQDEQAYDLQNMAEIFMSSGWQRAHENFVELMLLGYDHTERGDECAPEVWYGSQWWTPIAISGAFTMYAHPVAGGRLMRLTYTDDGYAMHIWMAGYNQ